MRVNSDATHCDVTRFPSQRSSYLAEITQKTIIVPNCDY